MRNEGKRFEKMMNMGERSRDFSEFSSDEENESLLVELKENSGLDGVT